MNKLKELREKAKLSQKELADLAGMHYRTIGRLEAGKHKAHGSVIKVLAIVLNVKPEELELR